MQDMVDGDIIWIDQWELFHKTTQTGNNLITNGGARNDIGALIATDWVDSNADGLADGFTKVNGVPSIVSGNGFSGNAQRIDADVTVNTRLEKLSALNLSTSYYYRFKHRSNNGIGVYIGKSTVFLSSNLDDAIICSGIIESTLLITTVRFYVRSTAGDAEVGDWMEN
jgi:hypothetical protein